MALRSTYICSQRLRVLSTHLNLQSTPDVTRYSKPHTNKYAFVGTSASSLPELVFGKKGSGRVIIRPMRETDLNNVNNLIQTRHLVDFSETDIYSMQRSPHFLGLVAENEDKAIVGFSGFNRYAENITTAGHMIILDKYRNAGLSDTMINYMTEHFILGEMSCSYGYEAMKSYYTKVGWFFDKKFGSFHRINGKFGDEYLKKRTLNKTDIHKIGKDEFPKLSLFDTQIHTQPRSEILYAMCFHPNSTTYVAVDESEISGYVILRKAFNSYKIAPLFANDSQTAQALFQRVAEDIPRESVISMVVTPNNNHFNEFMRKNEFEVVHSLYRISNHRRQTTLPIDFSRVFSLTNSNFALC